MAYRFNNIVIGGGSAGLISAYISAAVKAKVALIEKHKMGGDCLNTGCVPSKTLIKTAKFIHDMRRHRELGIKSVQFEFDFAEVMDRVQQKIGLIEPHDSMERYSSLGVDCFAGDATILDPHTVEVNGETLQAKNLILALGASPLIPPIEGLDQINYLTSENLWGLRQLPKRLIVLGGGPIGCEMAQAFARFGSEVTQIEMMPRILGREDEDVAAYVTERFSREGINILTTTKAAAVRLQDGQRLLVCETPKGKLEVAFDELLIAVGRKPNTGQLDCDRLGIRLRPNGTIAVDSYLRTDCKTIYACGDVTGPYQFTHTASHQAWYCAVNSLFSPFKKFKVDYRVIPWVTFTDPEIAQVGLNEQAAKEAGIAYEVSRYEMSGQDRAIAESENYGLVKVLTKPGSDKILGATVVSHLGGELIGEFVQAMKHGLGLNAILGTIHAYPTYIEANKAVAGVWKKANAPAWALRILERFHAWRR